MRRPKPTGVIAGILAGLAAGASVLAGAKPPLTETLIPVIIALTALATVLAGDSFLRMHSPERAREIEGGQPPGRDEVEEAAAPPVPDMLPVRPRTFRGRTDELAELEKWRAGARPSTKDSTPPGDKPSLSGALLIMIHGRPGVGKSALALEYAHRIADDYPGGVLYANLDNAGNPRPPAEVLRTFLRKLGWTRAMPTGTERRSALFRSLLEERGRVLVVLDAASGPDQVLPFVPTVPGCTVIVTSRRDVLPAISAQARSLYLDVPSAVGAAEIVRAYAQIEPDEHRLCTAEVVHLCAGLPLALRSAGEQAAEPNRGLCAVVEALRADDRRLDRLRFRSRDVRREFDTEYQRLTEPQRRAFRLLTLVQSKTFLPWVLQPLMDVPRDEAENLLASLYKAHLLDVVTGAVPSGLPRYQFHPLILLFAREQLARSEPEAVWHEARARLHAAYLEGIEHLVFDDRVRERGAPRPARLGTRPRFIHDAAWLESVHDATDEWVRAEYPNLVESVLAAAGDPALCWRTAQRLGDCVPYDMEPDTCLDAFAAARHAAERDGSEYGMAAVELGRGGYLVGIERYEEGIGALRTAVAKAERAAPDDDFRLLALRARRRVGEAYSQMGAFGKAVAALDVALAAEGPPPIQRELKLIQLVRAEALAAGNAGLVLDDHPFHDALTDMDHDDDIAYRAHLNLALIGQRRREWGVAAEHLRRAGTLHGADARRAASVTYRTARLWLGQALCPGTDSLASARRAASYAADAAVTFQRISNPVGAIRAQCLLVRALVVADQLNQASEQLRQCRVAQRGLRGAGQDAIALLTARTGRAEAELTLARKDYRSALNILRSTADVFEAHGDTASAAEVRHRSAKACGHIAAHGEQVDMLMSAAGYYHKAGDYVTLQEISDELAAATRELA